MSKPKIITPKEPVCCAACGSEAPMDFHQLSVDGNETTGWVCNECGHAHFKPKKVANTKKGS